MAEHRFAPTRCPECGHKLDAASGVNTDDAPSPGSATVCINCGTLLEFSSKLKLRAIRAETLLALEDDSRILLLRMQRVILAYRSRK